MLGFSRRRTKLTGRADPPHRPEGDDWPAEVELAAAERLSFFSDAVVAIAITLLAIDLPMPEGTTTGALLRSAGDRWPAYLSFLISFVVIAAHWSGHHRTLRWVNRTSSTLQRWSIIWLLAIIVTPFAARILYGDGAIALRFTFYALIQVLATGAFIFIIRAVDRGALLRPDTPATLVPRATRRLSGTLGGFAASVPLFFVTEYAWVLWFAVPILWGQLVRWRGRRVVSERAL